MVLPFNSQCIAKYTFPSSVRYSASRLHCSHSTIVRLEPVSFGVCIVFPTGTTLPESYFLSFLPKLVLWKRKMFGNNSHPHLWNARAKQHTHSRHFSFVLLLSLQFHRWCAQLHVFVGPLNAFWFFKRLKFFFQQMCNGAFKGVFEWYKVSLIEQKGAQWMAQTWAFLFFCQSILGSCKHIVWLYIFTGRLPRLFAKWKNVEEPI